MIPVYLNRLMKARNSGREPSIGSRPEDDGPLGQVVDSLSPSKSEKRRRFPPENRGDTDFLPTDFLPISFQLAGPCRGLLPTNQALPWRP